MASIDSIFTKSNLSETQKQAKMIFGRILIALRKSNKIKLYSLLESVESHDICEEKLKLTMSDKVAFDMVNNKNDIEALNVILNDIKSGFTICII